MFDKKVKHPVDRAVPALLTAGFLGLGFTALEGVNLLRLTQTFKDIETLDQNTSYAFSSVDQCIEAGITPTACQSAWGNAKAVARHPSTRILMTDKNCRAAFKDCTIENMRAAAPLSSPAVIGWQMGAENPAVSVPLYSTQDPDTAVRRDGKRFNIG